MHTLFFSVLHACRATALLETITAAFEMEEMLYELKDHSSGLNCGRWYVDSTTNYGMFRVDPSHSIQRVKGLRSNGPKASFRAAFFHDHRPEECMTGYIASTLCLDRSRRVGNVACVGLVKKSGRGI